MNDSDRLARFAERKQDFERNPPRCANCVWVRGEAKHGRAMRCGLGRFGVMPNSICNRWEDAAGEKLEGQS